MGKGIYFLLAYGMLQPVRARGPISTDEFWARLDVIKADAASEGIAVRRSYEVEPPYFAIPVADTRDIPRKALAIQMLGGEPRSGLYAVQLAAFPQLVLNALGNHRDEVEVHWTRVTYLASLYGITLPTGQWLWINEFE